MPITFDTVAQIQSKLHFWIALIKTFRTIYILFRSEAVRIFPLFFGNDIIMMLLHGFLILVFLELWIDYQPAKFQCGRLSLASSMERLRKHDDDVIMTSFRVVGI